MRRILHLIALVLLIAVPSGVQAAPELPERIASIVREHQETVVDGAERLPEVADAPVDPRAEAIERLLERYGAPIQGLGSTFVQVADRDGYDWRLLVSIAGIESSFGKHQLGYNLFGWGGGQIRFQSFEDSIDQVSRGLAKGYISRGLTTPEAINPVYCPPNPLWASKVRSFMNQIGA